MRRLLATLALLLVPLSAMAQDRSDTILVLDSSGSMWGQIDGVAKMTIAQAVVTELLATLPVDQNLGLTAYGHREKGNCTDIETLVAPGPDTRAAIAQAVAGIRPLGKTPMTDAVIAAAEALRYTENKATVILVSDGVETCNPDPCAAARLLEAHGVDFTAHVIGFDIGTDPQAIAQMQCIAAETGGQFRTAANAAELATALATVAAEPELVAHKVRFAATLGEGGQDISGDVFWTIEGGGAKTETSGAPVELDLNEGSYTAIAYYPQEERSARITFTVTGDQVVTVVFDVVLPEASVTPPSPAYQGAVMPTAWTGPNAEGDYITIGPVGRTDSISYAYTEQGNPVAITMPSETGTYEMRYIYGPNGETLASATFVVGPVDFALDVPATAVAGATIPVPFTGPNYDLDFIGVGVPGDENYLSYVYTAQGNPASLPLPTVEGDYEVRYYMGYDSRIVATAPITLTPAGATITPPEGLLAGATVSVPWTGPNYDLDFLSIGKPGESGYETYVYTARGNPAELAMPAVPGEYEIRYQIGSDGAVLAAVPITVGAVAFNVSPPATAVAGSTIDLPWSGPNYELDFVSVGLPGESYINYAYTERGNPAKLQMPVAPGTYEIRYQLGQDNSTQASATIELTPVSAAITEAPASAPTATDIQVTWDGPAFEGDFIGIGPVGDDTYVTYAYVTHGNPVTIPTPDEPGSYEIKYHIGQGESALARKAITVE